MWKQELWSFTGKNKVKLYTLLESFFSLGVFLIENRYFKLDCGILSAVLKQLVNIAAFFPLKCFLRVVTNGTCLFLSCEKLCYLIILS